jgi:hypothetical protein
MANSIAAAISSICMGENTQYCARIKEFVGSSIWFIRATTCANRSEMIDESLRHIMSIATPGEDAQSRIAAIPKGLDTMHPQCPSYQDATTSTAVVTSSSPRTTTKGTEEANPEGIAAPGGCAAAVAAAAAVPVDPVYTIERAICDAIDRVDHDAADKFARVHARSIGVGSERIIEELLKRLPHVGNIVEYAPHASLTVAHGIVTSRHIHCGAIDERVGMPPFGRHATVGAREVQTMIINARSMQAFMRHYVDHIYAMIGKNASIFAIIVHADDARISCADLSVLSRCVNQRDKTCVTVISGCEKKVTSVLDVMNL